MKRIRLIIFSAALSFNTFSQGYVDSTDVDNFNVANAWDVFDKESAKAEITKDGYLIEHRKTESSHTYFKKMTLDYNKDFSFEVSMTQKTGVIDQGYGLIWGMTDWDDYNSFIIAGNGYYKIGSTADKKNTDLLPWKKDDLIKSDKENTVMIEKKGNDINFYINGKKIFNTDKSNIKITGQYLGIILYSAKQVVVKYVKTKGRYKKLNIVPGAIKGYKHENLGTNINTIEADKLPFIAPDGKTLYFCNNINDGKSDEASFSTRAESGSWNPSIKFSSPINNTAPNAIVSSSADNNILYLLHTYNPDGTYKTPGVSYTKRTENGWSVPKDIVIENFYNTHKYSFHAFSQDNMYMLSAIQRKDSRGNSDIYVSLKKNDGSYSEPMNLGDVINTYGSETTPFLASDNKTMYFSSAGHAGYGSNDIFVTHRLDDSWKNWTEPQNLGPEINTTEWDAYFNIPASGEIAYMVTSNNSIGRSDIVKIKLSEEARPKPVVLVSGKVLNKKTNQPLSANIKYFDLKTNEDAGGAISNPTTGEYNIILQTGKQYGFRAEKESFYAVNDMLDLTAITSYKEIRKDLFLVPIEVGQSIRLNNVFFDFNKSELKPESFSELDRLVDFLKNNPKMEIELGGHTDNVGSDDYNIKLSQQRTESVLNYLASKGINKTRLQAKGYGKNNPVATNDTEEGKSINRRVEFTINKQ
ncbi:MAG: OmpA family protein [Sphingobacteriaceae bacterium]|nr:OmpA family protein [Sphingobacteriaceae bacterium]